jgi:O-antigen/teichoic acid export membrane protein
MSIIYKAFKGASWLALFRSISQTFSWIVTIIIARILVPEDFGLIEMATILTGYVVLFSELGLGAAIIQREKVKDEDLSSLFWFVVCWGLLLAIICILLAYPTVAIFNEGRILRVTQSVSLLFIIGSLLIVPRNKLHREMRFKVIGFIEASSIIISSILMIVIAKLGGGVWTLVGGHIIRESTKVILVFSILSWRPSFHFRFFEIKPYIKFGLNLAIGNSLYYIYTKSDRFFGGLILGASTLGYYSLALQLSSIPTDKLVSLINSVSFPVFSRYQKSYDEFHNFYLKLVNLVAFFTFPIFIGAIFISDQLIPVALGQKWMPIILPFKLLCIAQLIISITSANGIANSAQGRPHWNLYVNIINVLVLPVSFYIAVKYGLNYLVIPWLTLNPLIRLGYTYLTLRKLAISIPDYFKTLFHPVLATMTMLFVLTPVKYFYFHILDSLFIDLKPYLFFIVIIGAISYASYIMIFRPNLLTSLMNLRKNQEVSLTTS